MEEQNELFLPETFTLREDYLIPLLSDYGFKVSFAEDTEFSRKAIQLLAHLETPIDRLEFLRNEIEAMTIEARSGIYDVVCRDQRKRIFIIEMQTGNYTYFKERILFYLFQMYCALIKKGEHAFTNLQPVYCICIVKDSLTKEKEWHQKIMLRNDKGTNFTDSVEIHLVELGKFPILREEHAEIKDELEQLVYTMKYAHTFNTKYVADFPAFWGNNWLNEMLSHLDLNRMSAEDKAVLEMKMLTMRMLADAYKKDVAAAEKAAAEKAEHTALVAVAKNCLEEGFDIPMTSKIAKLSIEEVTKIKQNLENEKN